MSTQNGKQDLRERLTDDTPMALELRSNVLREKPFLRKLYQEWYDMLAAPIPDGQGAVVELGSGGSFFREVCPEVVATDVMPHRVIDIVADGCYMPFRPDSLRGVVMTNALHHLPDVRSFLQTTAASMRSGGVISIIEPWVTAWSRLIYGKLHYEPFDPMADTWELEAGSPLTSANDALPWIVFHRDLDTFEAEFPEWRLENVHLFMPVAYLLSGGVARKAGMPGWSYGICRALERLGSPLLPWTAMFAHIVLRRT